MGLRFDRPRPEGVRSAHTVVLHVVVMVAVSGGVAGVGSAAADADRLSGHDAAQNQRRAHHDVPSGSVGPRVEPFLEGWRERAEFMSKQPGFRSFRLHRALTPDARFQLVNVAERESADALHAARARQYFQESTRRSVEDFEVTAHPAIYRVAVEVGAD